MAALLITSALEIVPMTIDFTLRNFILIVHYGLLAAYVWEWIKFLYHRTRYPDFFNSLGKTGDSTFALPSPAPEFVGVLSVRADDELFGDQRDDHQ